MISVYKIIFSTIKFSSKSSILTLLKTVLGTCKNCTLSGPVVGAYKFIKTILKCSNVALTAISLPFTTCPLKDTYAEFFDSETAELFVFFVFSKNSFVLPTL